MSGSANRHTKALPVADTIEPLAGDCNGDGKVDVDELVLAVDLALGVPVAATCPAADADGDGVLAINDLIADVRSGVLGCESSATARDG
jgi:hypothetical protein